MIGKISRFDSVFHGGGHFNGVFGVGDAAVEQNAVGTQLHGDGDIAGRADAGIDDDGVVRVAGFQLFQTERYIQGIEDTLAGADGAAGGHDGGGTGLLEAESGDGIVTGVAEDGKAFLDQLGRGLEGSGGVGQEGFAIAQDFQFDPAGTFVAELFQQIAAEQGDADGIFGSEAAGGVGEDGVAIQVDEIEQGFAFLVDKAFAADGDGDGLTAGGVEGLTHQFVGGVLAGSDEEGAGEDIVFNFEGSHGGIIGALPEDRKMGFDGCMLSYRHLANSDGATVGLPISEAEETKADLVTLDGVGVVDSWGGWHAVPWISSVARCAG